MRLKKLPQLVTILLLSLTALVAAAQSPEAGPQYPREPDNDAILREILNSESPYYYPSLFIRYMAGDTTLNLEEYRHLYYGYAWQPTYKPFESPQSGTKLLAKFEKGLDSLTVEDCHEIIRYAGDVMKTEPFHPSTVNFLTFAYGALGDTINERVNAHRFKMLIETIQSSGTGLREKSAWHILYYPDADDVLGHMNLIFGKNSVVSRTVEFIPLYERRGGVKGYYFNFERIYWNRPDQLPEKRTNSNWQFNNIPLKKKQPWK